MEWNDAFMTMFRNAVARYHERPQASAGSLFMPAEVELLQDIGYTPEEMHGYIEDYATQGAPSPSSILLIAAARRAFFLTAQRGISGNARPVRAKDLPSLEEDYQGIPYLPYIIRKAEAKLHGVLDSSLMYYDAQDREFLRTHGNIAPADFLYLAWQAAGDKQKMVKAVLKAMNAANSEKQTPSPAPQLPRQQRSFSAGPIQSELQLD